jgi:uncharacterized protein YndB with AHSA1/START domain
MTGQTPYRYADGPSIEVSKVIAASPAAVWRFVSDINLPVRFSTELQRAEWTDGFDGPAVGAKFRGTNEHPVVGTWQAECTITAFEPEREFGWEVAGPGGPAAAWGFRLEPVDGGTLVTQRCRIGPGPSGLSPALERMPDREHDIIARRLGEHAANMQRNLDGLAELV